MLDCGKTGSNSEKYLVNIIPINDFIDSSILEGPA